jgi:hypothetical protein
MYYWVNTIAEGITLFSFDVATTEAKKRIFPQRNVYETK